MTHAVCYLQRADRGAHITSARFVAHELDESWSSNRLDQATTQARIDDAADLAHWLAQRVASTPSRQLHTVFVDADGAACTWLTAPSSRHTVVEAVLAQAQSPMLIASGDAQVDDSLAIDSLLEDAAAPRWRLARSTPKSTDSASGTRMPVLITPDATIRLVLDELDADGLAPERVESIWHAIARAWDPTSLINRAPASAPSADRVVVESVDTVGIVLVDLTGRLAWVWSREGRLISAGSVRLAHSSADDANGVQVQEHTVARLASDWLAWAAQIGVAPRRIVCITPNLDALGEDDLDAGGLGRALAQAWPNATIDMVVHDDPIGATLRRLSRGAASESEPTSSSALLSLTHRPSRSHRAMHRWIAVGLIALAAVLAGMGIRADRAAGRLTANLLEVREESRELVRQVDPVIADSPYMMRELATTVEEAQRRAGGPTVSVAARPILQELHAAAMVLSGFADADVVVESISIDNVGFPSIVVLVPQTPDGSEAAEFLRRALQSVETSIAWEGRFDSGGGVSGQGALGPRNRYRLTGQWRERQGGGA